MPPRNHVLVVAEKPDAARKIAGALGNVRVKKIRGTEVFEVQSAIDGRDYVVCSAIGHVYELSDPEQYRGVFPVFDIGWFPKNNITNSVRRKRLRLGSSFEARLAVIKDLSLGASGLVNACDYDIEGETIGSNILEFVCEGKVSEILRAKYSTLTEGEIRKSFTELSPASPNITNAGRMRHMIDFLWGVNLSRALSLTTNKAGRFSNITIGRVQGPTLAFVVDREIELMVHVPIPFWTIKCALKKLGITLEANYKGGNIRSHVLAQEVFSKVSEAKLARVKSVEYSNRSLPPRYPFDLVELQKEAFRIHRITPSTTLAIAEKLYLRALISYPRTSSQKLPRSIDYRKILDGLALLEKFGRLISQLRSDSKRRNVPWQGPASDPAHPAIYPTGESSKSPLREDEAKIFDLVVRRFFNVFAPNAIVRDTKVQFDLSSYEFESEGSSLREEGWTAYYPYTFKETLWPNIQLIKGEELEVESVSIEDRYDPKPVRYSEMSLVTKMTAENIGTKSTRADTVETLIKRGYLDSKKNLLPTENALTLIHHMKRTCPQIVSTSMTRTLEKKIESLEAGEENGINVLSESLAALRSALSGLKGNRIGSWATISEKKSEREPFVIGACPTCKTGQLHVIKSFKTHKRFVGCSNYGKGCKTSSPLPRRGIIRTTGKNCTSCGWPTVVVWFGRNPWRICPNILCPTRGKKAV